MHPFDVAASDPCPFCPSLPDCPREHRPNDFCLESWPLGRPSHRQFRCADPKRADDFRVALANSTVAEMAARWRAGEQLTDEDYLRLRGLIEHAATGRGQRAYYAVMEEFLWLQSFIRREDAAEYYGIRGDELRGYELIAGPMLWGAVVIANEYMVRNDQSVPVPSRFERIVAEAEKTFLFFLAGMPFLSLPRRDEDFKRSVEQEWRRLLRFGNGFYGFTVFPRIYIEDLVRYQKLGGGDDLVSWSISNWVIWSMTAFPHPVQTVAPDFGEKALKARLEAMFEPLVQSYATQMRRRAWATRDQASDVPKRGALVGELRALLSHLIDEYDFMYGKPDAQLASIGTIGWASSPEQREQLDRQLSEAGLSITARDLAHVGFARYVSSKFGEYLRNSYPFYGAQEGVPQTGKTRLADKSGESAEVFRKESARTKRKSDVKPAVHVAFEKDGVEYLYRRQMALVCGVSQEQLRHWDRSGDLSALRMSDIDPGAPDAVARRRVYPHTNEVIERIERLSRSKGAARAGSTARLFTLVDAAAELDITVRTLKNWRDDGKVEVVKLGRRVFIPREELDRLRGVEIEAAQ